MIKNKLEDTLKERNRRYGDFTHQAILAQQIKGVMWNNENWGLLSEDKKQALEVIADKISRIINGDPDYKDNWHDIAGYAKLAEDRCIILPMPGL